MDGCIGNNGYTICSLSCRALIPDTPQTLTADSCVCCFLVLWIASFCFFTMSCTLLLFLSCSNSTFLLICRSLLLLSRTCRCMYSCTSCAFCLCAVLCLAGPSFSFSFKHNGHAELLFPELLGGFAAWLGGCEIFLGEWQHDFSVTFDSLDLCFEPPWVFSAAVCWRFFCVNCPLCSVN